MTTIIEIKNLVNKFGKQVVHDGANLQIKQGEIIGIVGGSGSGKSVLLRSILGLNKPQSGEILYKGQNILKLSASKLREFQKNWGMLFQQGALFSSLTVLENVLVPLKEHTKINHKLAEEIALLKIALVGLPQDSAHKYPSQLSGGMKKRAALARALALDPEVLFLDEPTAGLDPIGAAKFDDLIKDLRTGLGLTVVLVTHDLDTLFSICDRVAVLVDRQVICDDIAKIVDYKHPWIQEYFQGPRARAVKR